MLTSYDTIPHRGVPSSQGARPHAITLAHTAQAPSSVPADTPRVPADWRLQTGYGANNDFTVQG